MRLILFYIVCLFVLFLRFYLFLERGEEEETERKRNIGHENMRDVDWLPLMIPQLGSDLKPRHVPFLGVKPGPFGFRAGAKSTEPHHPGLFCFLDSTYK